MVKVSRSTRASRKRSTVSKKLLQWNWVWKPRIEEPEQAVEHLLAPGQDAEGLGVGPGDVPEGDDGGVRQALAHQARQQREVVVLHQDDRVLGARLVGHHLGEAPVHVLVVLPVGRAEHRAACARCGRAATGLRWRSRSSSPAPPPPRARRAGCGSRMVGRHHHVVVLVDRLAVGVARAVRDPGARSRRARSARARSPGRSPGAGSRSRCPCAACGCRARGWRRSAPRRPSGPGAGCAAARRAPRWSGSRRASGAPTPGRAAASAGRARSGAAPAPCPSARPASAAASRRESSAFMPATQPRQLISAITTVMSATTAAMAAKSYSTYFLVSSLRRCTKLMSCTIISWPSSAPS